MLIAACDCGGLLVFMFGVDCLFGICCECGGLVLWLLLFVCSGLTFVGTVTLVVCFLVGFGCFVGFVEFATCATYSMYCFVCFMSVGFAFGFVFCVDLLCGLRCSSCVW